MKIVPPPSDAALNDSAIRYFLSDEELDAVRDASHWIAIDQPVRDPVSAAAKINIFLIALWIVRPTLTHVSIRVQQAPDGGRVSRMVDRFQWIKDQLHADLDEAHLAAARDLLPGLFAVYAARARLKNALSLTFRGCISTDWQSSFICFAAAVEGLLTHAQTPGLTSRLADAYSKLLDHYGSRGPSHREMFIRLYNVRSDVIHGRAYKRESSLSNLTDLTDFSNALRELWRVVLVHEDVRTNLEQDDAARAEFFASL